MKNLENIQKKLTNIEEKLRKLKKSMEDHLIEREIAWKDKQYR